MEINQFLNIMDKIKSFQQKMERENIPEQEQQIILKIYISELTDRINTELLEVI